MGIFAILMIVAAIAGIITGGFNIMYLLLLVLGIGLIIAGKFLNELFKEKMLLKSIINIGIAGLSLILFISIINIDVNGNIPKIYQKGYKMYDDGEYDKAIVYFNDMITENPQNYEVYFHLASVQMENEDYVEAEKNLNTLLSQDGNNIDYNFMMTNIKMAQGNYSGAISHLNIILENDMENQKAYTLTGKCYDGLGDGIRALAYFKMAYRIDDNFEARLNVAKAYGRVNDIETAMEYFEMAEKLAKNEDMHIRLNATKAGMLKSYDKEADNE